MEVQTRGLEWTKFMVPSMGSIIQVGAFPSSLPTLSYNYLKHYVSISLLSQEYIYDVQLSFFNHLLDYFFIIYESRGRIL